MCDTLNIEDGEEKDEICVGQWSYHQKWTILLMRHLIGEASLVTQMVKNLPAMQEIRVQSLGGTDSLEKGMATHSSILAWKIPWTKEPGRLQSLGLQRVRHNWVTHTFWCLFSNSSLTRSSFLLKLQGRISTGEQRIGTGQLDRSNQVNVQFQTHQLTPGPGLSPLPVLASVLTQKYTHYRNRGDGQSLFSQKTRIWCCEPLCAEWLILIN